MAYKALHVIIKGKVQGVGYRYWTLTTAKTLAINGWVRNVADGSVEAVFAGEEDAVLAMLAACNEGPAKADVSTLDITPIAPIVETGFSIQ